ncbi:MAG TPA: MFS transporter [Pirellulaceae bacterium]|nr:MFS transporter [Pirellulaceae bacterium]
MSTADSLPNKNSQLWFMLRAFSYRNYRLFFCGQIVSLIGTWLSLIASSWIVYKLALAQDPKTAPFIMGVVGFAGQLPIFLLSPVAGVWIDRWRRHRVLMATQFLSMLQSFALAALILTDHISIPLILLLNIFQGLVNAVDIPTRQSFVVDIIEDRSDLSNAIALNSSMVHLARLVGPVVGSMLMYFVGAGYCFVIDGFSYLAVLIALAMMHVKTLAPLGRQLRVWQSLREGLAYAWGFSPVSTLLLMVAVTSLMTMSQSVLMPIFGDTILVSTLGDGRLTYGCLLGASGVGAVVGSLYLASRRSVLGLGRVIALACLAMGLALLCFSISPSLWISLPLLMISGCAMVVQMASCNTVLQTIVDDDKRGRVMALFTMAFMGMSPFGSLLAGFLASRWGPQVTIAIVGATCVLASLVFAARLPAMRPLIRPIYIRKGILPEVAAGLQSTATQA